MGPLEQEMFKQVINEMVPIHKFLGVTVRELGEGYALLHLPFKPELVGDPRHKRWHGGMVAAILDSAGGAAAITTMKSEKDQVASIDMRVDFLEAGKPLGILAEGRVTRNGNSVLFASMKAWHEETGEVIAEGRGVFRVRRYNPDGEQQVNMAELREELEKNSGEI